MYLLITAIMLLGLNPFFFMVAIGEAVQDEPSEQASASTSTQPSGESEKADGERRPWWEQYVTFSGDLRTALALNIRGNRNGTDRTNILPVARVRGGVTLSPTPWLTATARLAGFFDEELQGLGFRFSHRRTIQSGDVTFDELFLMLKPYEFLTIKVGRLQTEDPPFELDSVVLDSLSRHDSSGLDVDWTDGIYMLIGRSSSFKLHLIGQVNPEEGPTNGVGVRGPLDFMDGASRVTYYVGLEAPPLKPFTQLAADVTIIPQALRPLGLGTDTKEDVVAFTMRGAADFPLQDGSKPLTLHPFTEFGAMVMTPQEKVLGISTSEERAGHYAFVMGLDLKHLGPGSLGFQFGWAQAGYLLSPDYPNNAWSIETRYKVGIAKNTVFELRYRHRQDIAKLVDALERQTDDNFLARMTVKF
ncbi:MAG: hypothetical protein HY347_11580 [candidate division NC10 bacterium]|nr:hypothetical protein [candidate division NC10 bacterium]